MKLKFFVFSFLLSICTCNTQSQILNDTLYTTLPLYSNPEFFVLGIIELQSPIYVYHKKQNKLLHWDERSASFITERQNLMTIVQKWQDLKYAVLDTNCYAILSFPSYFVHDYLIPKVKDTVLLSLLKENYPNDWDLIDSLYGNKINYNKDIEYIEVRRNKFLVVLMTRNLYTRCTPLDAGKTYFLTDKTKDGIYLKVLIPLMDK